METFKLNSGACIPAVGLAMGSMIAPPAPNETEPLVRVAIQKGVRFFDCASIYGNEAEIGRALCAAFKAGEVQRDQLFIVDKLANTRHGDVECALRESLQALGLDYLDCFVLHWPVAQTSDGSGFVMTPTGLEDVWRRMEECQAAGLCRAIGVANFSQAKLERVLKVATIQPALNQLEMHPLWRQDGLLAFCKANCIHVTALSPLASPSYLTAEAACGVGGPKVPSPMRCECVGDIAKRLNKTPAQVLLRWHFERGCSAVPRARTAEHICEDIAIFDFSLPPAEMNALNSMPQRRLLQALEYCGEGKAYKDYSQLWDEPAPMPIEA